MKLIAFKLIFLTLLLISCINNKEKPIIKDYPIWDSKNDSLKVKLELKEFNTFGDLLNKLQKIICTDSVPQIVLKTKKIEKHIYPLYICEPMIFDPKARNTIYFQKGQLIKNNQYFEVNSLTQMMKRDFTNFGKNPDFADSPELCLIIIEYDLIDKLFGLEKILIEITNSYDLIETDMELKIMLYEYINIAQFQPPSIMESKTIN